MNSTRTFDPRRRLALSALALAASAVFTGQNARAAEPAFTVPAPTADAMPSPGTASETAVLAGGCFWGVQGVFQHVQGVSSAVSGYAGGSAATATYAATGRGDTGHAEAVRITFDPNKISYGRLLQIYFSVAHNPTQLNYQGPDRGPQYRSTIFPATPEQARVARAYIEQLNKANTFGRPLATTIEPDKAFYPAEAYHQDFLARNPRHPYIAMHDLPKIKNLQQMFPERYQATPVLVGSMPS